MIYRLRLLRRLQRLFGRKVGISMFVKILIESNPTEYEREDDRVWLIKNL